MQTFRLITAAAVSGTDSFGRCVLSYEPQMEGGGGGGGAACLDRSQRSQAKIQVMWKYVQKIRHLMEAK